MKNIAASINRNHHACIYQLRLLLMLLMPALLMQPCTAVSYTHLTLPTNTNAC